jgi:hypothetical protein
MILTKTLCGQNAELLNVEVDVKCEKLHEDISLD